MHTQKMQQACKGYCSVYKNQSSLGILEIAVLVLMLMQKKVPKLIQLKQRNSNVLNI